MDMPLLKQVKQRLGIRGFGIIDPPYDINPAKIEELKQKYIKGIAEAIGVPPEYINEKLAEKWVQHYIEAFVKPEDLPKVMEELGRTTGEIYKDIRKRW